jgi:hypothetical protein
MQAMGKIFIYIIPMVLFLSSITNAQKVEQEDIEGVYYKLFKDRYLSSSYSLELHSDGSFNLKETHQDGRPQCNGKWKLEDGKFVVLKCDEVKDLTEALANGYMNKREHKLLIINKNKLQYSDDIVLKRK